MVKEKQNKEDQKNRKRFIPALCESLSDKGRSILISVLASVIVTTGTSTITNFKTKKYEKNVKTLIEDSYEAYIYAVNKGDVNILNNYIMNDSSLYREYGRTIPDYFKKNITLEANGQTIKYFRKEDDDKYRITAVNKFNITYKDGSSKDVIEEMDYIVVKDVETKEPVIDKIESWKKIQ